MLIKRTNPRDNKFDVFVGNGWDNHIRIEVDLQKKDKKVQVMRASVPVSDGLLRNMYNYFNKVKA